MGHFVTSFPEITGKKAVKVTIVPEKIGNDLNALGYAQYRKVPSKVEANRELFARQSRPACSPAPKLKRCSAAPGPAGRSNDLSSESATSRAN